ncbi:MAG: sigma factor-like helix-turn-helix DNA-binding protein, partial [Bacillota bacterium]|nr:sigma factor-like helix-turn-helix DNA-binding protein [Bacillota bacterium]
FEGFSYEEIASLMQCSIGTVRSRIHRGRKILREALRDYLGKSKEEAVRSDELP